LAADIGIGLTYSRVNANVIPADVYGVAINFMANRTPLAARLPTSPCGSASFLVTNDKYRGTNITASVIGSTGTTTVTVSDGNQFMKGDVIEIDNEQMLVTADPSGTGNNDLTVTRGYAGTTAATHLAAATVYLIGNTRTGGEVDVNGASKIPTTVTQWLQNFQHPYAIAGSLAAKTNLALPPGVAGAIGREKAMAIQHCMDDIERACYYGRSVSLGSTTARPQMAGLRSLLTTNNVTSPTSASAYKPTDLMRDVFEPAYRAGGNPDILLVSTNFMLGLATWGHAAQRIDAGRTVFGTPVNVFESPFLMGVSIIPCPLLRPYTAIALTSNEVQLRVGRQMFDQARGNRGDAIEGDIIAELALEVHNEDHHAMVTGITGWSA